ncbi:alkyl hydroperoxide reductase subunit F [Komagataeibacter rhaeticus]|uniref:Thioredoxin reductase n=1 Tax=Komagataeibacter rhaeticus TaxID=215221 RepID=A0A181CA13_9PROT|nr:alkyl hydroperoxide reductase subunit F [Komagataeibacter rhaeticus]ATU73066.1 alkyl hydroperoxide reductase subunit F [Komagataeibacter xylinus]EGG77103.1 Alkyl hydroperoxide reductase subunit F [Gluconacetobacter sp. SXCC-1]KDU97475.1 alkyl hydroperoxide reductase [Komagataeibacter rhaeticus AF1]MBL7239026.1 alkyl hydroperoxide reductase subunit F [Komagataeibacter rhaeticus]PYD54288.1 alkyl hydroperoxide reductase subunit F [Komagataeibacter rhaeticus]
MLQDPIKTQLKGYLAGLAHPVVLEASLDDSPKSREMHELLHEVAALSDRVQVSEAGQATRRPSFVIRREGGRAGVSFAAIPMGHEFTSFVLALLQVGGHPPKLSDDEIAQIKALPGPYHFETYVSLSCQNCPDVVQALNAMSVLNPNISNVTIDGALFQDEVTAKNIMSVPQVYLNGAPFETGRADIEQLLAKLDADAPRRAAEKLKDIAPFDVLIIGGGPAGASAAVYAARKGLRTGLVAERFGGQVMDTAGIENFISIPETDGPKLAAALEAHVRAYDVEIITGQQAKELFPAPQPGGLHGVALESGAILHARTVILATGAHWRHLGVPGEEEYRNKGVAYCPHCDGPFYKGKRVAVAGGGNSGVEAAIDLAGIVAHVTLLQRGSHLKADKVLQDKLRTLSNVTVLTEALTTRIEGNGRNVTGLTYRGGDGADHHVDLEGVFVQIGLLPNTGWLKNTLRLSDFGEIVVNDHGATSVPGVFAAGDATTTPYKQIVIAIGAGATAALSAFDYLIRVPVAAAQPVPAPV